MMGAARQARQQREAQLQASLGMAKRGCSRCQPSTVPAPAVGLTALQGPHLRRVNGEGLLRVFSSLHIAHHKLVAALAHSDHRVLPSGRGGRGQ